MTHVTFLDGRTPIAGCGTTSDAVRPMGQVGQKSAEYFSSDDRPNNLSFAGDGTMTHPTSSRDLNYSGL